MLHSEIDIDDLRRAEPTAAPAEQQAWGRVHAAANALLDYCNPIARSTLDEAINSLGDLRGLSVLDVGCGKGYVSALIAGHGARVVAYDKNTTLAEAARARLSTARSAMVLHADTPPHGPWDVVVCLGSADALCAGPVSGCFEAARSLVRAGGLLLFGDGYWKSEPPASALASVADETATMTSYPELMTNAHRNGWQAVFSRHSSTSEWDRFMRLWCEGLYRAARVDDAPGIAIVGRLTWRRYVDQLRPLLGFVTVTFRAA